MTIERYEITKQKLNEVSPSYCVAKWLQVTIHLQNGLTHSCHHPIPHKIPLAEIESNPSALHNTKFKKLQRKAMLEGIRPPECDYCWRVEDSDSSNYSDRMVKSSDNWAAPYLSKMKDKPWSENINPTYVEVSFGHECQFKCMYCSPAVSSAILAEYHKHGAYEATKYHSVERLKSEGMYPYAKDEVNPYVNAFWKWWPEMSSELEHFRITGGEPLLNPNTFKFLDYLEANPMPKLEFAINSNLGIPDQYYDKFLTQIERILQKKNVKGFEFFTSLDTAGNQAEFIRHGLNYNKHFVNAEKFLDRIPETRLIYMCTFNVLSIEKFDVFLEDLKRIKLKYFMSNDRSSRVILSTSYLRYPEFLAPNIITPDFIPYVEKSIDFMLRNSIIDDRVIFADFEIAQMRRILQWLKSSHDEAQINQARGSFYSYIIENDMRKNLNFLETFPKYKDFLALCEESYLAR